MKKIISLIILGLILLSCKDVKTEKINHIEQERDSLLNIVNQNKANVNNQIASFLTFQKEDAEQAMNFYIALFDNSKIDTLKRWGKEGPGKEGTIMHATFNLNGKVFMCSDSPAIHEWNFTPAISNYVECKDESELERLFTKLSENGKIMMPLDNYGFSKKFGFVEDKFGVSWQLNLN